MSNSGRLVARLATTTFSGLETLDNTGIVAFGDERIAASNLLSAPGMAFEGSGDSQLLMEATLGTAGQADCSATLATAAYVRTEIEEVFQAGFEASYDDISSLRGALGLRVGGAVGPMGFWAVGRAWKEFAGEGVLTLGTTIEDIVIHDDLAGEFQELGAGLILSGGEALEGFVSGGAKFADGADSYSASFGIRLRW